MSEIFEKIKEIVRQHNGYCLSLNFENFNSKLEFKCSVIEHPSWWALPQPILKGHWCRKCSFENREDVINGKKKFFQIIKENNAVVDEESYSFGNKKLKITCVMGHQWTTKPTTVLQGCWCPDCSKGLSERICRQYFEQMFGEKFPKNRPEWLRGSTGYKLELDGYSEKLNIAFEYQGIQHYKEIELVKNSTLNERQERDQLKLDVCIAKGVRVIVIPTLITYIKLSELQFFIISECQKLNIYIPFPNAAIDIRKAYLPFEFEKQRELENIASNKNGMILSNYSGANNLIMCKCNIDGFIWETLPSSITRDHWCPKCKGVEKKDLKFLHDLASLKNGLCFAKEYTNSHTKVEWHCGKIAHEHWLASSNSVQKGKWCPQCARESSIRITSVKNCGPRKSATEKLIELQVLARQRGGELLSTIYKNNKTKMTWSCPSHGMWEATPQDIKNQETWCPKCRRAQAGKTKKDNLTKNQRKA